MTGYLVECILILEELITVLFLRHNWGNGLFRVWQHFTYGLLLGRLGLLWSRHPAAACPFDMPNFTTLMTFCTFEWTLKWSVVAIPTVRAPIHYICHLVNWISKVKRAFQLRMASIIWSTVCDILSVLYWCPQLVGPVACLLRNHQNYNICSWLRTVALKYTSLLFLLPAWLLCESNISVQFLMEADSNGLTTLSLSYLTRCWWSY